MANDEIVFIHGRDARSRTEARRHVSRIVRKRERETRTKHVFVEQPILSRRLGSPLVSSSRPMQESNNQRTTSNDGPGKDAEGNAEGDAESPKQRSNDCDLHKQHHTPGLDKRVGTGNPLDPFDTLSIPILAEAARCLKHYSKDMPWVEFQIPMDSPLVPRIKSALEVPLTLHAMVAQGAIHRATLLGDHRNAVGEFHLGEATKLMRQSLPDLTQENWQNFVQPMFELAFCEQGLGRPMNCRLHLSGLRQLLVNFGGLQGLQELPNIQLLTCHMLHAAEQPYFPLVWLPIQTLDRILDCYSRSEDFSCPNLEDTIRMTFEDVKDHVTDLCWTLNQLEAESLAPSPLLLLVRTYFRSDNRLSESLTNTLEDKVTPNRFGPRILHRMAGLLILAQNVLFYLQEGDRPALELYLEKQQYLYHPNIKLLKLRAMQNGMQVKMENSRLNWEVVRMMQVYKLMCRPLQEKFGATLVHFLQGIGSVQTPSSEGKKWISCTWSSRELMPVVLQSLVDVVD